MLQTFVNPGDEVLIPAPAFPMFKFYAQVADAKDASTSAEAHNDETAPADDAQVDEKK